MMTMPIESLTALLKVILFAPLLGALFAGFGGRWLGKVGAHWLTILGVALSFGLSLDLLFSMAWQHSISPFSVQLFSFAKVDHFDFSIGFLIDRLSLFMMVIVTFVSLMVHVYSIGYMADDPDNPRFFAYISGFTFSMLALVMADNFLLLFFGWEAVGLFSYLLIGFWFKKETANVAAFRAFIANRFGDLGFLLGIAGVLLCFGTLNYAGVFAQLPMILGKNCLWSLGIFGHVHPLTFICLLLFAGAAGKSAQIPLHIWLEGSMEGPTPISALIHAATMVTAGVFMLARLSPLFNASATALSLILVLGAATALFMGILGIVQRDIKRVIAYSTLSQLGYMMVAQGTGAYELGMFHLMTHAFFKALLFLAAGSVIVGMHHEQDMFKMGGLARKMPVTYVCMLIGALALSAVPPFSGFFSKDLIIDSVEKSPLWGHGFSYVCVVLGTFVTGLYTFRLFFLVFHGKPKMDSKTFDHVKESSLSILIPLILLAIPSVLSGWYCFQPLLQGWFEGALVLKNSSEFAGVSPEKFMIEALKTLPFWLGLLGIVTAWVFYILKPEWPGKFVQSFSLIHRVLLQKYGIDALYDRCFGRGSMALGKFLANVCDEWVIDRICVQGLGWVMRIGGSLLRTLQSGYLMHYLMLMVLGLVIVLFTCLGLR